MEPDLLLYAWVGEDELGLSPGVGLKQGVVPAGLVPLVATTRSKIDRTEIRLQLQAQADHYRKPIRLVQFRQVEVLEVIEPS